jgi:hypothetical protein
MDKSVVLPPPFLILCWHLPRNSPILRKPEPLLRIGQSREDAALLRSVSHKIHLIELRRSLAEIHSKSGTVMKEKLEIDQKASLNKPLNFSHFFSRREVT